jgi:hypothetical protein
MRLQKATSFNHLEKVVNEALGLIGTKGSGSVAGDGDGKGKDKELSSTYSQILSECKYTEKTSGSISIKKRDFWKTERAARRLGRIPAMFSADGDGEVYAILRLSDLMEIYRGLIENEKGRRREEK